MLQVGEYNSRLTILEDMDSKLKKIDEFNGQIKLFNDKIKELEDWLPEGRKRMDDLLNPDNPIKAEDRVVQTMELQVSKRGCLLRAQDEYFASRTTMKV